MNWFKLNKKNTLLAIKNKLISLSPIIYDSTVQEIVNVPLNTFSFHFVARVTDFGETCHEFGLQTTNKQLTKTITFLLSFS